MIGTNYGEVVLISVALFLGFQIALAVNYALLKMLLSGMRRSMRRVDEPQP